MWGTNLYKTTKLTLELREIVDNGENSVDIWAFDYPTYYEGEAKKAFERKVIEHYYFRQIGQETVGRWLHYFRAKIREIMPYYKELYESVDLLKNQGDPLESYNLTETYQKKRNSEASSESSGTSSGTGTNTTSNERRLSNTPQGSISNLDKYMSEAEKLSDESTNSNASESSGTSTTSGEENEEYTLTRRGNIGVQPLGDEIRKYRDALINVDMMIIDELEELFLQVY